MPPAPAPAPKRTKTLTLQARVGAEIRAKAEGLATQRKQRLTDLVFKAVQRELIEAGALEATTEPAAIDVDPQDAMTTRVTVSLPRFIKKAVDERAAAADRKTAAWLAALVQSNVMRNPVLLDAELAAIERTTRELSALGRNINQVARALNDAPHQTERVKLEQLANISAAIAESRKELRALLRASRRVWVVEP